MQRSRSYPRSSNKAPRQLIDEAQLRRPGRGQHGGPIGGQLTSGANSRSYVDYVISSAVNSAE